MAVPALLTYTDFQTHPMYIAPGQFSGATQVANIILETQKKILKELLGAPLFAGMDADYDTVNNVFQSQKWIDFVDGYEYQESGVTVKWAGVKNMLKGFIFFEYQKFNHIKNSQLGNVLPNIQNATVSTTFANEVQVYNEAIEKYGFDWCYMFFRNRKLMYSINTQYPEWEPTAYNFLRHRQSEFPNWNFSSKYKINEFNI
jgi:hypothetical protein